MGRRRETGNVFYVYAIFRPWDGAPCYIGKGKGQRWRVHTWSWHKHYNPMLKGLFKKAKELGLDVPIIKIRENLSNEEALATEVALIAAIGRKPSGPLFNMTDGGDGVAGHIASEEHRRKISEAQKNRKPASEETRAKISRSRMGMRPSEETRKKLSVARMGNRNAAGQDRSWFRHTDASKAKLSASRQGIPGSFTGKKHTAETRKRISVAREDVLIRNMAEIAWLL